MSKRKKTIPSFKNAEEEFAFWSSHDTADYLDWSKAKRARFSHLKPSTKTISLRLPETLLSDIRFLANKRDVPYQSLLKILLAESVERELHKPTS